MNKTELISACAESTGFSKKDSERFLNAAIDAITAALVNGEKVQISGFGIFTSKVRDAHPGKNPATGEAITVPAKRVAIFKPAKQLKDAVNS